MPWMNAQMVGLFYFFFILKFKDLPVDITSADQQRQLLALIEQFVPLVFESLKQKYDKVRSDTIQIL